MASYEVTLKTPEGEYTVSVPDDMYILDEAENQGSIFPIPAEPGLVLVVPGN